jgi:hypothetical protein
MTEGMTRREITIWITYDEDEDVGAYESAIAMLGKLNVIALLAADTVDDVSYEWEAKVVPERTFAP